MALIEIENLSVTFTAKGRKVQAVRDVSLAVAARESFGLVGESGAGKSMIGLYLGTSGVASACSALASSCATSSSSCASCSPARA